MTAISEQTFTIIQLTMASISIIAGLATLWILNDMNKWTGFLWLVAALSIAQMLYDIGFFFRANTNDAVCVFLWYLFQVAGGMATTLVTNVIAFIVASIAMTLRSYDIKKNFAFIMSWVVFISLVPALLLSITSVMEPQEEFNTIINVTMYAYAAFRILSISINFGAYLVLTIRLRRMGLSLSTNQNAPLHPVAALSSRMIYYPIVQLVTRLAAAWMEFRYTGGGGTGADDDVTLMESTDWKVANVLYSISSPSAGLGFFFIFLYMQPAAWSHLKARLCCRAIDYTSPGHSLKADILRESHSVCINEIDGSSDDNSIASSDMEHSPLSGGLGFERGFSSDRAGRTRSQGSLYKGRTSANPVIRPTSSDDRANPTYRDQLIASDEYSRDSHNFFFPPGPANGKGASMSGGNSFLPSRLALLDDDELAGLVDKLANINQHEDISGNFQSQRTSFHSHHSAHT